VPGYEILGVLGRGGMGIVYKAHQKGLGRLAAVKVILSGSHSGEQDLARFRQEAETLGRLNHPNIVRIHEIGEHDGLPFFSLEYCPGGSLARRLAGSPLPPAQAAELVATLARAMHAAHTAGIIHRDLKPANVLLAEDGTPRITDFGLAKRAQGGDGLTQSGVIVGTPSYMAPEQAGGRSRLVTTAADVYALGAILYECLTGRPPFRAATPIDTILQVLQQEPEPPSALRPGIDRGLELICLKCLAREPGNRYGSADALAADLERWRAGEPLSVQPPAFTAILRVWLRQNFGAAGWTVVVGLGLGVILSLLAWLNMIQPNLLVMDPAYRQMTGHTPWLGADWEVPPWLIVALTLLGLVAVGFAGLATARLVRPRNRQADVAAGLVSGAVAGVVFFTLGFGWFAELLRLEPSLKAVSSLSTAAWDDPVEGGRETSDSPRPQIRKGLLEKYPGLRDVPVQERGRVMYEKVACDLFTGIPLSIWAGMVMSIGVCVAFGAFSTVMGGQLLRGRGGVRKVLPPYLEGMVPAALLCLCPAILIMLWLPGGRLILPIWYFPLLIGVSGLSVTGVLRGWHWVVRLPLHATWIGLLVLQPWLSLGWGHFEPHTLLAMLCTLCARRITRRFRFRNLKLLLQQRVECPRSNDAKWDRRGLVMAAVALTPRVRLMTICDRVRESKMEAGVYHLRGVRQRIMARTVPVVASRLWLFLILSSQRPGTYPSYIRVIDDESDKAIFFAHLSPHPQFEANDQTVAAIARLKCSFPRTGQYTVQVWFYREQGNDVLKGEMPFSVAEEGD
jgi:hypothetical protein